MASFDIESEGFHDANALKTELKDATENEHISPYRVSSEDFYFKELKYTSTYRAQIKFSGLKYAPEYGNRCNEMFDGLAEQITEAIKRLFKECPGQQIVKVQSFRPGCLIVSFDLVSEGFGDGDSLRSILAEAMTSGYIGQYKVSSEGFDFRKIEDTSTYRAQIKFSGLKYAPEYGNRCNEMFDGLAKQIAEAIKRLFKECPGQQIVIIQSFRPGCLIVSFDLVSEGFGDGDSLRSILAEAMTSGYIGQYKVSSEGFDFRKIEDVICTAAAPMLAGGLEGSDVVSPGYLMVSFELRSQGFDNADALRTTLEEAIESGYIGPYKVSPEGFNFRKFEGDAATAAWMLGGDLGVSDEVKSDLVPLKDPSRGEHTGKNPGSLMVSFELRSKENDDADTLKTTLEKAIQSGYIGKYIVSPDGFDFIKVENEDTVVKGIGDDNGDIKRIEDETHYDIGKWTDGMIQLCVCEAIAKRISTGKPWTSLVGNAGDGKTTLGYMVLKKLRDEHSYRVFIVNSPEHFNKLKREMLNKRCLIMMNDCLGGVDFDSAKSTPWTQPIQHFLETSRKLNEKDDSPRLQVVFISRTYILEQARTVFGKCSEMLSEKSTFNVGEKIKKEELEKILDHHLGKVPILVSKQDKEDVIVWFTERKQQHGFPLLSSLYAKTYSQENKIPILDFFKSPLTFLNETMQAFIEDEDKTDLFKRLLSSGGHLNLAKFEEDKKDRVTKAARPLDGSYITIESRQISWRHPSILESVFVVYGRVNPEFVIDECDFSLISRKVKRRKDSGSGENDNYLLLDLTEDAVKDHLCARFRQQLLGSDYEVVLNHDFCKEEVFLNMLFDGFLYPGEVDNEAEGTLHMDKPGSSWSRGTLLQAAARVKNVTAVKWLLYRGADVDKRDVLDETVLHRTLDAFRPEDSEVVEIILLLLRCKADINTTDGDGKTPLHRLCQNKHVTKELLAELLAAGADVGYRDRFGRTPLDCLRCNSAVPGDGSEMMQRAMDLAESRDNKYSLEQTDTAALRARFQQRLLDGDFYVLGHSFCRQEEFLEQLFDGCLYQGDVDDQAVGKLHIDKMGSHFEDTLLHAAVRVKNLTAVKCLIHRGADVDKRDKYDDTALDRALILFTSEDPERAEIIQMWKQAQADKLRQQLLDGDYNVLGDYPCQEKDFLELLFDGFLYQGNVDDQAVGKLQINKTRSSLRYGETLLHAAVRVRNVKAVQSLLRRGADVNETDECGKTALDRAELDRTQLHMVHMLRQAQAEKFPCLGADPSAWEDESACGHC